MAITERQIEVDSIDALLEFLEDEQERPCHNSFLDVHEPAIISNFDYERLQFSQFEYAIDDSNGSI